MPRIEFAAYKNRQDQLIAYRFVAGRLDFNNLPQPEIGETMWSIVNKAHETGKKAASIGGSIQRRGSY